MKKLFEKHETIACIGLIIIYVAVSSVGLNLWGTADYRTAMINTILSVLVLILVINLQRVSFYGLRKPEHAGKCLYFIPLALFIALQFRGGISIENTPAEILCHVITMLNVGFLEEIIFRGFLFRMMEKSNKKSAIIVSALTFGMGHIVNLLNGEALIPTLMQVLYATAIGYLLVIIFCKTKSLVPCIIMHGVFNASSIVGGANDWSIYLVTAIYVIIGFGYALFIQMTVKENRIASAEKS